jgi:hypothetical protein
MKTILLTRHLLTAFFLCSAIPLTTLYGADAPKMKMTTEIPASITTPDEVKTRLGTLKFTDGFPDQATVDKLYDNLDFQHAVQAYLVGLPVASVEGVCQGLTGLGPANQTVSISETLLDSKSLFLTANDNTAYTLVVLDLTAGPLIMEVPPMVLGPLDDAWFHWVTDVGITGPDKGKGGKYLLLPPGYTGEVPDGYFVAHSHTYGNILFFRTFLKDGDPKPGVESVKKLFRVYPLAKAANPPEMKFVNISGKEFNTIGPSDYSFWEAISQVIQREPGDATDPFTLGFFASIGIEKGKPFAPDERMKAILKEAAAVGDATARTITYKSRLKDAYFYPNSAWMTPFIGGSYKFEVNGARILDAYSMFFFYATGITPAMTEKMVGQGSQYAAAFVDAKGDPLDGAKTYRVHLPPNIPAKDFWSLVVYDNQTRSMLQTDQQYPSVSSQKKGLQINEDKSVDVWFGPTVPSGHESNWVQTVPGKGWNVLLRLYGPGQSWFDKTWQPGEFELEK